MGKEKNRATYRPMPPKNRFWGHNEQGYTDEELAWRKWALELRAHSGIHSNYLNNPSSWFKDDGEALIYVYPSSWVFDNTLRTTRDRLSLEQFYVHPIASESLQWAELYHLMQDIGNYLNLRNSELIPAHYNQPMNFIILDINLMLRGLSQTPQIQQVYEQLVLISRYIRTIEMKASAKVGSDKAFLADIRHNINEEIQPKLALLIKSQELKDRLQQLKKHLHQISLDRNLILHFALSTQPVDLHAHEFSMTMLLDKRAYPTQAAKACAQPISTEVATNTGPTEAHILTSTQLKDCAHFKLITQDPVLIEHYAKAITDLYQLEQFQHIIAQISHLTGKAGELYTIHQFKEQMLGLLEKIKLFIATSSVDIRIISQANTDAYYKAIQMTQSLSIWERLLTTKQRDLSIFIKNQDNLALFSFDLDESNTKAQASIEELRRHLVEHPTTTSNLNDVNNQIQELTQLMQAMHQVNAPYEARRLPPPVPSNIPLGDIDASISKSQRASPITRWPSVFTNQPSKSVYPRNQAISEPRLFESHSNVNELLLLGLSIMLPLCIIALYFILRAKSNNKERNCVTLSTTRLQASSTSGGSDDSGATTQTMRNRAKG